MRPSENSIEILAYRPAWEERYAAERDRLVDAIGDRVLDVEHVGSTSVPGLAAKPIVDICPIPSTMDAARACKPAMADLGYEFNAEREHWLAFERYDEALDQQFNVHFHVAGTERLERVLLFRNYLRDHDHARDAYASAKRYAAAAHADDHSAYNDAKDDVVESYIVAAREAGYEPDVRDDGS